MPRLEGAYSVTALVDGTLVAFRDPFGFRPLTLGQLGDDWVVASETCALDLIGADVVRDVRPGEVDLGRRRGPPRRAGRAGGAQRALHLRARLLRATRLAGRRRRGARRACPDGRAARAGGAGRGRSRHRHPRLGHAGGDRLLEGVGHPVQRGAHQEPLRRAHVHPARAGHARAGDPDEVQPARRGRGEAHRRRRRLDRPREHDAPARADALRRGRRRGARPHLVAAGRLAVLLRDRHGRRGRARRRAPLGRGDARARRRDLAPLPLGRRHAGGDELPEDSVCRACFTRDYPTSVPPKVEKLRFEPAPA